MTEIEALLQTASFHDIAQTSLLFGVWVVIVLRLLENREKK